MVNVSFTVSAWVIANSLQNVNGSGAGDNAIFGQLDANTQSRSLHIVVRKQHSYMGFYDGDTSGSQILLPQQWYHVRNLIRRSFITHEEVDSSWPLFMINRFNNNTCILTGYSMVLTGIDIRTKEVQVTPPLVPQVSLLVIIIGMVVSIRYPFMDEWKSTTNPLFHPDHHWFLSRSHMSSSSEVLWDATQTLYYAFESDLTDEGPLGINGSGTQVQYVASGRVGQALDLTATPSFVEARNLIYLGTHNRSYSLSIWIRPQVVMNGTIIHVASTDPTIGWSIPMLGFTADGSIAAQSCSSNGSILLMGPPIDVTQWTHVAVTYNPAAEFRLWVNGTQVNSTSFSFLSAGVPVTATLGSSPSSAGPCTSSLIVMDDFSGFIDEFRLYSRVLSSADVRSLANPWQ